MSNEILPIGSVVLLKNAKTELVVMGYAGIDAGGAVHDYTGVPYPAGLVTKDAIALFDAGSIQEVRFFGYRNLHFQIFSAKFVQAAKDGMADVPMFRTTEKQPIAK